MGISELLERKPKALSGGQRQRVAVGRAIVRHPKVFLFDEPLSNLDAKLRVQMRAEISKLHQRLEATMIYVTHDQVEAMTMGNRITVLKDGVVQQIDSPLNLYDKPVNIFVAGFIGSPAMNFIDGKVTEQDGLVFANDAVSIDLPDKYAKYLDDYLNKEIVLGIRPEHLYVDEKGDLKTTVEVVEPMGNEIFIYTKIKENKVLARVETRVMPQYGDKMRFRLNKEYIHLFDKETEKSLIYG